MMALMGSSRADKENAMNKPRFIIQFASNTHLSGIGDCGPGWHVQDTQADMTATYRPYRIEADAAVLAARLNAA